MAETIELVKARTANEQPPEPTLDQMMDICESLDQGLKLATQVIADLDVRVRKLELAVKKNERKLVVATQMPGKH